MLKYQLRSEIFKPGKINPQTLLDVEEFRFPLSMPYETRIKELEIDRRYNDNSTFIVFYNEEDVVASTIRIIHKLDKEDKLPVEFSKHVDSGCPFEIPKSFIPVCEIGGLKVSDDVPFRMRYKTVLKTIKTCVDYIWAEKFNGVYITCNGNLESFYRKKFSFNFASLVTYDDNSSYHALYRNSDFNGTPFN